MVHLIFVCKYRKRLLIKYGDQIQDIFRDVAKAKHFEIITMEIDKDHIHLLARYPPTKSILDIVRLLKQISTYRLWRQNDNRSFLSKHFWEEQIFWSSGYFACSIGNVSQQTIENYIRNQG